MEEGASAFVLDRAESAPDATTHIELGREGRKDPLVNSTRFCLQLDRVAQLRGHGVDEYGVVVHTVRGHGPLLWLLLLLLLLGPGRVGPGDTSGWDG